jgi:hypothetical protein
VTLFIKGEQNVKLNGQPVTARFQPPPGAFTLELPPSESWSSLQWTLLADPPPPSIGRDFIVAHRDRFADDIRVWQTVLTADIDQTILDVLGRPNQTPVFSLTLDPKVFVVESLRAVPLHLLLMRAPPLALLNWMALHRVINVGEDPALAHLIEHVSAATQVSTFLEAVWRASNTRSPRDTELSINRQSAFAVRTGTSTNLNDTIIAQMAHQYGNPDHFRRRADDPWRVSFSGERGIDLGGPARELVSECATDLCSPACGLVVQVPNARNDVGDGREWVLPFANPRHTNVQQQYRFAGAIIAIALRTGLVQDFCFPPLVWEFLVRREIRIERLYEVDEQHRQLIQSLQEVVRSGIPQSVFASRFNLTFTVVDVVGEEQSLTPRGRLERVTMDNAANYISLANEYRLNELKTALEKMADGLWENLNIPPNRCLGWRVLEHAACGAPGVPFEILQKCTEVRVGRNKEQMFWRVAEALTPAERSALLKFATGRSRLPPNISSGEKYLVVDDGGADDVFPYASTCFNQIHWPNFSSFAHALRMTRIAIECTGSFEQA